MDCRNNGEMIARRLHEAQLFTNHFGTFAKSDYEILMFSIYLNMLETEPRDYDISIDLGIPESKVRSLRVKAQLLYPRKELKWQEELEKALSKGQYDLQDQTITIMIEDPSVLNLLKSIIEETYGVVYKTLNSKHLCLPIESYLLLAMELEEDRSKALSRLNSKWKEANGEVNEITRESFIKKIWSKANKTEPIKLLLDCAGAAWPVAAPIIQIIKSMIP